MALSKVERHQQYLDKMIGEAEVLKTLVEECLDDDPAVRPTIGADPSEQGCLHEGVPTRIYHSVPRNPAVED